MCFTPSAINSHLMAVDGLIEREVATGRHADCSAVTVLGSLAAVQTTCSTSALLTAVTLST